MQISSTSRERWGDRLVVASISGGRDSTALALTLMQHEISHVRVLADTGFEVPETYDYLNLHRERLGPIKVVRNRITLARAPASDSASCSVAGRSVTGGRDVHPQQTDPRCGHFTGAVAKETKRDTKNGEPKYASYQLPGGTNYRELLLTLPANKQQSGWAVEENADGSYVIRKPDGKLYVGSDSGEVLTWATERGAQGAMEGYAKQSDKNNYRSSHWDEPNILAHIRMNDRTDADGAKVLFIEEVQSDWQQGKRGGKDVPDAPFVGTSDPKPSVALAIKRIAAYAAENGYDKVAFINGEQSADRYDLSKQIARVEISRPQDGSFAFYAYKNKTDTVPVVQNRVQTVEELADHLGKDFAEKAAKQPVGTKRDYTGLDLKVETDQCHVVIIL